MTPLADVLWQTDQLPAALDAVALRLGLPQTKALPAPPRAAHDQAGLTRWLESAAPLVGLEAEAVFVAHADADRSLRHLGPALIRCGAGIALLLSARGQVATVLDPGGALRKVALAGLRAALCADTEKKFEVGLDELLDRTGLAGRERARARAGLLRERIGGWRTLGAFVLRLPPGAPVALLARSRRLLPRLVGLSLLHGLQFSLSLASWSLIGLGALSGRVEAGWLAAWALLRLTLVPLQAALTSAAGRLSIDAGALLRARLVAGSLRLRPEETRRQGVGQLLGQAIEAEAVESLGSSGAIFSAFGSIELVLAAALLAFGPSGGLQIALLGLWCGLAAILARRYHRARAAWTAGRVALTHDQVERMVGHRTRLAQQGRAGWHTEEDAALDRYLGQSVRMDDAWLPLAALVPRGWLVIGVLAALPALAAGADPGGLALSIFGVLLSFHSLEKVINAVPAFSGALLSFGQISSLFHAASRTEPLAAEQPAEQRGGTVLEARDLIYRHEGREQPVVRSASLTLRDGDRVLLQGSTGSGKSTLASLLTGLRVPQSGLLLLRGLDLRTLGAEGFRRRVACAPQFHENHIFTGTFAFNLLMGRSWPALPDELAEAAALCRPLDLGPLLERMPAGLSQTVGETGWQLSHGEKSRLFMARALLQDADVTLFDESFAALDPVTMRTALRCALERARTLVVIAHP